MQLKKINLLNANKEWNLKNKPAKSEQGMELKKQTCEIRTRNGILKKLAKFEQGIEFKINKPAKSEQGMELKKNKPAKSESRNGIKKNTCEIRTRNGI